MSDKLSEEQIDQLIRDVKYLRDEAEALKYVIEEVPYEEPPPEGRSIYEWLRFIDHAQTTFYRPAIEDACRNRHRTRLNDFDHYSDTFEPAEDEGKEIQKVLDKLIKHRNGIVNMLEGMSVTDWQATLYDGKKEIDVADFVQEMIGFDRDTLKEIADLVMVFGQEREQQREIEKRREQQPASNGTNSNP